MPRELWCHHDAELHCSTKYDNARCPTCPLSNDEQRSQAKWDQYFMDMALRSAKMSKDPSTKVGAVLVKDRSILATGFNGFPSLLKDDARLFVREQKLAIVVHAEMNAVLFAARKGIAIAGSTLYVAACDNTGAPAWGGPPCVRCLVECMQAGVVEFVSWPKKNVPSRWHDSLAHAERLLEESGLKFREIYQ